jgi:hypothetical protein
MTKYLCRTPLMVQEIRSEEQPLLAGDHSVWLRPDAVTLREEFPSWQRREPRGKTELQHLGLGSRGEWELGITFKQ